MLPKALPPIQPVLNELRAKHPHSAQPDLSALDVEKVIGNELGNREEWLFSSKMTTLLYYLIHSLLSFLAGVSKDNRG